MDQLSPPQQAAVEQIFKFTDGSDDAREALINILGDVSWNAEDVGGLFGALSDTGSLATPSDEDPFTHPRTLGRGLLALFSRESPLHARRSLRRLVRLLRPPLRHFSGLKLRRRRAPVHGDAPQAPEIETGGGEPGPSTLAQRALLDFVECGYDEFLQLCKKDARIGCVVLVSTKRDGVAEFRRDTLTDATLTNLLVDHKFVLWGGDVRDNDAISAAEKLQADTYPFVAFITHAPELTVLSRHYGAAQTTASSLLSHVALAPERALRAEQDHAFAAAVKRDQERADARAEAARAEAAAEAARQQAAEEAAERARRRLAWRRYMRRCVVPPDAGPLRVALRMPGGGRLVRSFRLEASLTALYALVDSLLVPPRLANAEDPDAPPDGSVAGEDGVRAQIEEAGGDTESWWGFRIVAAYPRRVFAWQPRIVLGKLEGLRGAQLVVEMVGHDQEIPIDTEDDDDGYDTEESEEAD